MPARPLSRTAQREALIAEARAVELPRRADVCVVGGGAAGLTAAIAAAEQGARTVVLERALECGRTILATGGGRCNFANRDLASDRYNDPAFVEAVAGEDFLGRVLRFFRASGLAWTEEDGWLFPASFAAASVRDVLLARARRAGVTLACGREVQNVKQSVDGWLLKAAGPGTEETLRAATIVLAAGGGSGGFGLPINAHPLAPILCPLACTGLPFNKLDGQRVRAEARLVRRGRELTRERGEILFRNYGVSGICAFNLSRHAEADDTLTLDLAPAFDASQLAYLAARAGSLAGIVAPQVASALAEAGIGAEALKGLRCKVLGRAETEKAQVTRGGFAASAFDPTTLAAVNLPGVFACGETLDVDGPCGGYNLAWAWVSGQVAGTAAAAWSQDPEARLSR